MTAVQCLSGIYALKRSRNVLRISVKIPENTGKITYNKRGETVCVECEYDRIYYSEKKYNIPKRTSIGKRFKEDSTMMCPDSSFIRYFPDVELPGEDEPADRSCCLKVGTFLAIRKIVEDYGLFFNLISHSIVKAQHL